MVKRLLEEPPVSVNKKLNASQLEFIKSGGFVASDIKYLNGSEVDSEEWVRMNIRCPSSLIQQINKVVAKRIGLNRNAWLLEAIQHYLKTIDQSWLVY